MWIKWARQLSWDWSSLLEVIQTTVHIDSNTFSNKNRFILDWLASFSSRLLYQCRSSVFISDKISFSYKFCDHRSQIYQQMMLGLPANVFFANWIHGVFPELSSKHQVLTPLIGCKETQRGYAHRKANEFCEARHRVGWGTMPTIMCIVPVGGSSVHFLLLFALYLNTCAVSLQMRAALLHPPYVKLLSQQLREFHSTKMIVSGNR